jgi:uncharacterized protein (DUF697 family)
VPSFPGFPSAIGLWRALAEVDPQAIAVQAIQPVAIAIVGPPDVGKETLRAALLGDGPGQPAVAQRGNPSAITVIEIVEGRLERLPPAHVYLYVVDGARGVQSSDANPARQIESQGHPVVYVVNKVDLVRDRDELRYAAAAAFGVPPGAGLALISSLDQATITRELAPKMVAALDARALALARTLPGAREAVAQGLIVDAARTNAQFSLVSSLPANIPVIGTLATFGADTLILTKNQALLVLKLAALHGRALDSKLQLATEIAPVVGAAFLWRSAARSIVGLLPGIVSALPKAAIAFAGTYAVGQTAHYYYRWGRRPQRETLEQFTRDAAGLARRSVASLARPERE